MHDDNEQFLANPTVVVDKALLYNDAGLDVTSDGTSVLTCAEFWLKPDQPPPSPRTPDNVETPATGEEHTEDLEVRPSLASSLVLAFLWCPCASPA